MIVEICVLCGRKGTETLQECFDEAEKLIRSIARRATTLFIMYSST